MHKYLAIIDRHTGYIFLLCLGIAYGCLRLGFSFNLNVTLFSIAVIFPLVFTIREAFRKRDRVIRLLSQFKASINAVYYCFVENDKMSDEKKNQITENLHNISRMFFETLKGKQYEPAIVRTELNKVFEFVHDNRDVISNGVTLKILRFIQDVNESLENTVALKMHGTPISLRAYCLVFIYVFPFIFIPTLVHDLANDANWVVYLLSAIHGFILISLYNVQKDMEDPFDQVGLDDIKLEEFHFEKSNHRTNST